MQYTPQAIDPDKLEESIRHSIEFQERQMISAKEKAEAYMSGYRQAAYDVIGSLHCSNYEKDNPSGVTAVD